MAKANIFPNIMSELDNVAYKIKFYMIHPKHPIGQFTGANIKRMDGSLETRGEHTRYGGLNKKYLEPIDKLIIAETGVTTSFYINDLGFNNYIGPRRQLKPIGITGQLNIIEPMGMSLYERIVIAAEKLKIENHLEAKYIIQINFLGYTPDGKQTTVPYEWLVPVAIKSLTSTITEQGSDYTINWVGMNAEASKSTAITAKEPFILEAKTYGEFLEKLSYLKNKEQEKLVELKSQAKPDRFTFQFAHGSKPIGLPSSKTVWENPTAEEAARYTFGAASATNIDSSKKTTHWAIEAQPGPPEHPGAAKIRISMMPGTSIVDFLTGVFMQTEQVQKNTQPGGYIGSVDDAHKASRDHKLAEQKSQVDSFANNPHGDGWYHLNNKWIIQVSADVFNGPFDNIRNTYSKNYVMTLNQYRVPHVVRDGIENNINQGSRAQRTKDSMNLLTKYGLLRKAYYWIYTGKNTEVMNFNFSFNYKWYVATDIYTNETLGERSSQTADQGNKYVPHESTLYSFTGIHPPATVTDANEFHVGDPDDDEPGDIIGYIEDLPLTHSSDSKSASKDKSFSNAAYIPDPIPSDLIYGTGLGGLETSSHSARVVYNMNSGDMMELTLTIRGDPYWLGHTTGADNFPEGDFAQYSQGSNYLYIEFSVPHGGVDPESGQITMSVANKMSGLYFVTNVQSSFSGGQFVQTLTAYQDATVGLTQVRNFAGMPGAL